MPGPLSALLHRPPRRCGWTRPASRPITIRMSQRPRVRFLDRTTPPHIVTLVLVAGLSAMSLNIFLPSLPGMALYFETDYRVVQLSVSLYLMATAILQIVVGPISDRFGRRRVLLTTTTLFLLMTLGCLLAPTIEVFLAFRMAQAVVAAGLVLSRAIVRDMVGPAESASMIGYVTMGMSLVPMIAPAIGGALEAAFGWQASFLLLLTGAAAILALIFFDLGETSAARSTSFAEQAREYPELLTSRRFWGYVACSAFCSGAFFAFLGGAPYVGTTVYGLPPEQLGFFFGAPAIGYAVGNFISGRYSVRVGVSPMILMGCLIATAGLVFPPLLYGLGFTHPAAFFGFVTFVGLGNGMTLPNATAGLLSVRPHLAGTASGLGGAFMIGGGAALSALAAALLVPGAGPWPLMAIMLITSILSVLSILYVLRRERQLVSG